MLLCAVACYIYVKSCSRNDMLPCAEVCCMCEACYSFTSNSTLPCECGSNATDSTTQCDCASQHYTRAVVMLLTAHNCDCLLTPEACAWDLLGSRAQIIWELRTQISLLLKLERLRSNTFLIHILKQFTFEYYAIAIYEHNCHITTIFIKLSAEEQ